MFDDIVQDIKAKLLAVANIGKVNHYDRLIVDGAKFRAEFAIDTAEPGKKEVHGCEFTRVAAPESKRGATFFRHHRFRISHYLEVRDSEASDLTFQAIIDAVCAKFRTADPEAGDAAGWWYADGRNEHLSCVQVEVIDARSFGGVLCHHADIYLTVTERIVA